VDVIELLNFVDAMGFDAAELVKLVRDEKLPSVR
jgi:hypothetical protein